jgi:hypothetical protein
MNKPKIRLSYSTMHLLLECERKFQLNRLLDSYQNQHASEHFAFGHALEEGCVSYLLHEDKDRALWEAYLAYHEVIDGVLEIAESVKKSELVAVNMVWAAFPYLDTLKEEWDIAEFNGKPAVQLSFNIDIDEDFYYVGYLDLALKNKYTGKYAVIDFKSTGMNLMSLDPLYMNSEQLIGYSIILDYITGKDNSEYDVYYFVGQIGSGNGFSPRIHTLQYPKSLKDRLNFFITLGMDVERLHKMLNTGIFPQRGSSCLKFNKPCPHFGTCGLHSLDTPKAIEEDTIEYSFHANLNELIADHLERII